MPLKDKFDKFITKTKRTFYIISIIWSYLSIALFIRYGFLYLNETNDKIMSTLTFVISIVYFIVTTLMLFFKKKENKTIKKSFKFIVNVFKLIMISTAIITLFNSPFSIESITSFIWKVNMVAWIILSLILEIVLFLIQRTIKKLTTSITKQKEQQNQTIHS